MNNKKFTVAICGGGIGGLACAAALSRVHDIDVTVYEAAHDFSEVGAGIGMSPRTWKIFQALGLDTELSRITIVPPEHENQKIFLVRKGDQSQGPVTDLTLKGGLFNFHRPEFQKILLGHVPKTCLHTKKRLQSFTHSCDDDSEPIVLHFQDGTTASCDLLIGADGVKSVVRSTILRQLADGSRVAGNEEEAQEFLRAAEPCFSGTYSYRTPITSEALRAVSPEHRLFKEPTMYIGRNAQVTTYPMANGRLINIAAFRAQYQRANKKIDHAWVQDLPCENLMEDFSGWEPELLHLLQCVRKASRWAVHTVVPLRTFVHGRVALLGDAAHAMMPYQGAGAGQAIEDAYVLANVLGHPSITRKTLGRALQAYDAVRRPFAQYVAAGSWDNGLIFTFNHPDFPITGQESEDEMNKMLDRMTQRVMNNMAWAYNTSIKDDVQRALDILET